MPDANSDSTSQPRHPHMAMNFVLRMWEDPIQWEIKFSELCPGQRNPSKCGHCRLVDYDHRWSNPDHLSLSRIPTLVPLELFSCALPRHDQRFFFFGHTRAISIRTYPYIWKSMRNKTISSQMIVKVKWSYLRALCAVGIVHVNYLYLERFGTYQHI